MKERVVLVSRTACIALVVAALVADAYVDAKFWLKDDNGTTIYMITDANEMIYGNVLTGQQVVFDASQSQSFYGKVDK